ncbi:MAG: N-acetylmuramoyl-L-alanine amidase [Bacteroidales bacterium]|nr:N-acetylmuramoyl-L-alanine amidase [Bacteroidales bacterium]
MKPITQYPFPTTQYVAEEKAKVQIYLHHTAGSADPLQTYKWWESNPERIATCVVIGGMPGNDTTWKDGEIVQGYSSKFWAWHLGLKESTFAKFGLPYVSLDQISIGVEICNWGQLTLKEGKFYNYVNRVIPNDQVCTLEAPFRGFTFYHAYTDAQIESVQQLLLLWKTKYNIPLTYHEDIWDVTPRALKGEPGIFTHNSVRFDKNDISPQPKMMAMLTSLQ